MAQPVAHPEFGLELRNLAPEGTVDLGHHTRLVVGVQVMVPDMAVLRFGFGPGQADHVGPAVVDAGYPGFQVPFPGACGSSHDDVLEPGFGPFQRGDVDPHPHTAAIAHRHFHGPDPAPVRQFHLAFVAGAAMGLHHLVQPFGFASDRLDICAPGDAFAQDILVPGAGDQQVRDGVEVFKVAAVEQRQPVFGIVDRKGIGQRFDGVFQLVARQDGRIGQFFQPGFLPLAFGDVGFHRHEAGMAALRILHRMDVQVDPVGRAEAVAIQHLGMHGFAGGQRGADVADGVGIGLVRAGKLPRIAPGNLGQLIARTLFERRVDPDDPLLGIGDDDKVRHVSRDLTKAHQFLAPGLIGGHVADHEDIARVLPGHVGGAQGRRRLEPAAGALGDQIVAVAARAPVPPGIGHRGAGDGCRFGRKQVFDHAADHFVRRGNQQVRRTGVDGAVPPFGIEFDDQVGQGLHRRSQLVAGGFQFGLCPADFTVGPGAFQDGADRAGHGGQDADFLGREIAFLENRIIADEPQHRGSGPDRDQHDAEDALHFQQPADQRIHRQVLHPRGMEHLAPLEPVAPGGDDVHRLVLEDVDHRVDPRGTPFVRVVEQLARLALKDVGAVHIREQAHFRQDQVDGGIRLGHGGGQGAGQNLDHAGAAARGRPRTFCQRRHLAFVAHDRLALPFPHRMCA